MQQYTAALITAAFLMGGATTALACPGKVAAAASEQSFAMVELDQLSAWVDEGKVKVFHATSAEKFAQGHIPTAQRVDYEGLTPEALGGDKAARVAFYCQSQQCGASEKAAKAAVGLGFASVFVFKGGIDGWRDAGKKVEITAAAPATGKARTDG
mgnify:CR=1 FL=1